LKINGSEVDRNSFLFSVKPASLIRISLFPKPVLPQLFLLFINGSYRVIKVFNETEVFVPSNSFVSIVGPILNKEEVFVPSINSIGFVSPCELKNVTINLVPGSIVKVLAAVPSLSTTEVPSQDIFAVPLVNLQGNLILNHTSLNDQILSLLNISRNELVVPAKVNLSLFVTIHAPGKESKVEIANESKPMFLEENTVNYFEEPALVQVLSNMQMVNKLFSQANSIVEEARDNGFYIGLEVDRLNQANKTYLELMNTSDPMKILAYQQEIVTTSQSIINNVKSILSEAYLNQILVFIMVVILVLALGSIFIEKREHYALFVIASFIILMTISYQSFPGFSKISTSQILIGVYAFAILFLLAFIAPYFLGEMKSEGGVSLIPAIIISISYSIGNLKKRKLRTFLVLISIIVMTLALTTLTSMKATYSTNSMTISKVWPKDKQALLIVQKENEPLSINDIGFISAQKEVSKVAYKVETPVAHSALGYIGQIPIYGIRGIDKDDPTLLDLKSIVYPSNALENLFNDSSAILISSDVASRTNIDVGMTIVFKGVKLKVVGLFDSKALSKLVEPDGSSWLPLYIPPGSQDTGPQPIPPDSAIVTTTYTAKLLGGQISRAYCIFSSNRVAESVGLRLASIGNYFVVALLPSENIKYFFRGTMLEAFGAPILIPIAITILNIATVFYTTIYERRNEIFTFSAVGLNPTHISTLFAVEATLLGLIGGSTGYILSMVIFRIFGISNIIIPVDVKTSSVDMISIILISIITAIIASSIPALRAARIATPSLLRRWKVEEKIVKEGTWILQIPTRIPLEKVEMFVNYLYERLPQSGTTLEIVISDVSKDEKIDENGNVVYYVNFKYGRGGNRPFNAYTTIEVKKEGENYIAYAHVRPESIYARMAEVNVHEVVTHVRKLVLEWSASKSRIAVVIANSIDSTLAIVKNYHPQLLIVYSRTDVSSKLRELRRKLRAEGIWPPAIEVRKVDIADLSALVNKLSEEILTIDTVCLDSDDGLLSSALAIASIRLNRNIAVITPDGKVYEIPAGKFSEYIQRA